MTIPWRGLGQSPNLTFFLPLLAILLLLGGPAWAISDPNEMLPNPALESRAEAIGRQLRCLVCQNESIEDSGADLAHDLRRVVRQRVSGGDTDPQVIAWMVARYGDFVRLSPPLTFATLLLWGSPFVALGLGGGAAWMASRRQRAPLADLTQEERARLADLTSR